MRVLVPSIPTLGRFLNQMLGLAATMLHPTLPLGLLRVSCLYTVELLGRPCVLLSGTASCIPWHRWLDSRHLHGFLVARISHMLRVLLSNRDRVCHPAIDGL